MQSHRFYLVFVVAMLLSLTSCPGLEDSLLRGNGPVAAQVTAQAGSEAIYHPASVSTITVTQYSNLTDALAAVNNGQADVFGHRINASDCGLAGGYSNLKQQWAYDSLACMLVINSGISPLNDSHLRRAFAFAVDKLDIASTAMHGRVDPIDFAMPLSNEFSIEKNEGGLFYHTDLSLAENELAMAGMVDVDNDSVIEAPKGSEICFTLSYPLDIAGMNQTAAIVSANLLSAGINNTLVPIQYSVLQNGIEAHNLSFNLAIYHQVMDEYGFGWVATTFLNSKRQVVGENVANIDDSRLSQLAIEYGDNIVLGNAKTLGLNAVRAVRDLCPIVPLFAYRWLSVYNDERFQGWANDTYAGAFSAWNPITVTAKGGMPNEMRVAVLPSFFDRFFTSLNPLRARLVLDDTWISKSFSTPIC